MKYRKHIATTIGLILLLVLGLSEADIVRIQDWINPPAAGTVRVEEFVDGDTLVVRFGGESERVRLIGVDTPETHHPDKAVQCYGEAASQFLKDTIGNQDVRLEADPTNTNRDRYDRLLRYVYLEDGTLVNLKIVSEGYGFAYVSFPFEKIDEFRNAQQRAREQNLGLWGSCDIEEDGGYINTVPAEDAS